MLSLEKVKSELKKYNYDYNDNILCGHTKSKVKWVLPTGIVNVMAFEQATSYLFGFSYKGVDLFPIKGDWYIITSSANENSGTSVMKSQWRRRTKMCYSENCWTRAVTKRMTNTFLLIR